MQLKAWDGREQFVAMESLQLAAVAIHQLDAIQQCIRLVARLSPYPLADVGIVGCRVGVTLAHQFLELTQIRSQLQQVGGVGVPQRMHGKMLLDATLSAGSFQCFLYTAAIQLLAGRLSHQPIA